MCSPELPWPGQVVLVAAVPVVVGVASAVFLVATLTMRDDRRRFLQLMWRRLGGGPRA